MNNKELEATMNALQTLQEEFNKKRVELTSKVCNGLTIEAITSKFRRLCYEHANIPTDFVLSKYGNTMDYKALKLYCTTSKFSRHYSLEVFLDYKEMDNWEVALMNKFPTLETRLLSSLLRLDANCIYAWDTRGGVSSTFFMPSLNKNWLQHFKDFKDLDYTITPSTDKEIKIQLFVK